MLVLTRKTQERIQIGDHITITIVRVKGQSVRVGIEATLDVRVVRGELMADRGKSHRLPAPQASTAATAGTAPAPQPLPPCHRGSISSSVSPLHAAVEAVMGKGSPTHATMSSGAIMSSGAMIDGSVPSVAAEIEVKTCVDGRRRVPGASLAPLMRRPQRLGPASVGALTGRLR